MGWESCRIIKYDLIYIKTEKHIWMFIKAYVYKNLILSYCSEVEFRVGEKKELFTYHCTLLGKC